MTVGTAEQNVTFSALTTPGTMILLNYGTSIITFGTQIGTGNVQPTGDIPAGDWAKFALASGETLRVKSDAAGGLLSIEALEK